MDSIKEEFERDFKKIEQLKVLIGIGRLRDRLVSDFKSLESDLDECSRSKANKEQI